MRRGFSNDRTAQVPQIHPLSSTSTKWRPDEPAYWFASHVATKFVGTSGPPQETALLCVGNQSAITLESAWIAVRSRYILACATGRSLGYPRLSHRLVRECPKACGSCRRASALDARS